jgi:hypothetical protein
VITDLFWNVATSTLALELDGFVWVAALVVGFFPLLKYVPAIGPYVPAARLVSVLVALLMCFLLGARIADERENIKNLRATVAAQKADLETARRSAADANQRASEIEAVTNALRQSDVEYIASLKPAPGCGFDPFPGGLRVGPAIGGSGPRSSAGARKPDEKG